jgi:6-phospho-3-hexuloisomerase
MNYQTGKKIVCDEINRTLDAIDESSVQKLVESIAVADKVFVIGVGRVLLMLQAFVKRLNHLGIRAYFVGAIDEPAITDKDVLIVGSGSGESLLPIAIVEKAKEFRPKIIHIGSNMDSTVSRQSDLLVRIPCKTKLNLLDEMTSKQPMSSLFEQCLLMLLDITALMIIDNKKIDLNELWHVHANLE